MGRTIFASFGESAGAERSHAPGSRSSGSEHRQLSFLEYDEGFDRGASAATEIDAPPASILSGRRERRLRLAFESRLYSTLESEAIEDGIDHPAQPLIEQILRDFPYQAPGWIQSCYARLLSTPSLAAALLQAIGRVDRELVSAFGPALAAGGLQHRSAEVREAAMTMVENWRDNALANILDRADESVDWLADYARRVVLSIREA